MAWTTTDLLTSIRDRQMLPSASTGSLNPSALLQYATDELWITLLPIIMGVRERYYETYVDTAYTDSTPTMPIPDRAIGGVISAVQYLNEQSITALNPMAPTVAWTTQPTSQPSNFWFENNSIVFYPPPVGTYGTIRQRYFQRPSALALTIDCARITAFDPLTGEATCTPPASWTTSDTFDFVPQTASKATPFALDSVASSITPTTMTFSALSQDDANRIRVGDWIALSGYTPIPEIPLEFQAVLAQAACVRALSAIGDKNNLPDAKADLDKYIGSVVKTLTPRDQLGQKKVISQWRWL